MNLLHMRPYWAEYGSALGSIWIHTGPYMGPYGSLSSRLKSMSVMPVRLAFLADLVFLSLLIAGDWLNSEESPHGYKEVVLESNKGTHVS